MALPGLYSLLRTAPRFRSTVNFIRRRIPTYVPRTPARLGLFSNYRFKAGREVYAFSNVLGTRRLRAFPHKALPLPISNSNFSLIGDNRRFHPLGRLRPLLVTRQGAARWVYPPGPSGPVHVPVLPKRVVPFTTRPIIDVRHQGLEALRFAESRHTVICLKRRIRREVMHAMGLSGLSGFAKPRFTFDSKVRC